MERVVHIRDKKDLLLAIIIRANYEPEESHFVTDDDALQNVGYFNYRKGHVVKSHYHPKHKRVIYGTPEVVVIRKGKLKLIVYDNDQKFVGDYILSKNDTFLLIDGGHAEEIMEDTSVFVVKQGPYISDGDKVHFQGAAK